MYLVVDTNVLYSFFNADSTTSEIFSEMQLGLFSPEYALSEIKRYAPEIRQKYSLSASRFNQLRKKLLVMVEFVPEEDYAGFLKKASQLIKDQKDVDFLALSLKLDLALWSNDQSLKQQDQVVVLNSEELIKLLKFK